jgi:C-terminal processing protease CtpA/Prc
VRFSAFVYEHAGQRILLLRVPDYGLPTENTFDDPINYLRALFFEQASRVDGLIYDQTHNPGGSLEFGERILAQLASKPIHGAVQQMHADRVWIEQYVGAAQEIRAASDEADPPQALELEADAHQIDIAYSTGQSLSQPLPLAGFGTTIEPDDYRWTKPFIVLADELSASMGDVVPLLVKTNHMAPIFGQRTTGAGGTVEPVTALSSSRMVVYLSRGLVTAFDPTGEYPEENFIEDLGVTPDIEYSHTLADFRAGYVGYVRAFSDALVDEIHRCAR